MSYAFEAELAPWVPAINDLSVSDIAAARAAERGMTANLPVYAPTRLVGRPRRSRSWA
ncbi:hypothetical protein [Streptomyces resistomycificus]|uniref:hypothetical protein n=1 Tax=Streptomyces resistomycificus TaxID=67356 RepID=UPI000A92DB20|nr:hypothetical protein [Streptomyces resistomycificus]